MAKRFEKGVSNYGTPDHEGLNPLPKEVLDVAHRIGLKLNVQSDFVDNFMKNRLPKKTLEKELKYTNYIFNEVRLSKKLDETKKVTSKNKLNSRQRKKLFNVRKSTEIKYQLYEEVNKIWNGYIGNLIDDIKSETDQLNLLRADYHGAYFVITASRNPALIGIKGFVIQETKRTFIIIKSDNRILSETC